MPFIVTSRTRQQPIIAREVNWAHPLLRDADIVFDGARPLVNRTRFATQGTGALAQRQTGKGIGAEVSASSAARLSYLVPQPSATSPWTVAAVVTPLVLATGGEATNGVTLIGMVDDAISLDRGIYLAPSTFAWRGYLYDGASKSADSARAAAVGRTDTVIAGYNGSQVTVSVDGGYQAATAAVNAGYASYNSANRRFSVGAAAGVACTNGSTFAVSLVVRTQRYWTAAEQAEFVGNPWQIFVPARRPVFYSLPVAGGGGGTVHAIWTPRMRQRQPPNPTRLSTDSLARGLVYAVGDLTSPHEAAAGRRVAHTDNGTAPSLSSAGNANAIRIAGAGFRSLTDPAGALRIFSGPMTVAMFARVSSLAGSWGALWTIKDALSANAIWACQRGGSSGDINMEITGGAGCSFTGAVAAVANNAPQMIVVSRTGVTASDTASLWAGGSKFTATMSGGAAGTVTSCVLNVGASRWNDAIASGDFGAALVWNRALSDAEVASLRENPWQVFAPVRRPVFYSLPAAGGSGAVHTIWTSRTRQRQPVGLPTLNRDDPAASRLVAMFAPWAKADAATGLPLSGWTGLNAIGAAIGGVAAIGAGSNYITGPAGYGRWAGKSVWGLILTFRLRSNSQTNTYVIRQGVGGGEQASLIYGYASQQFELFANGYSGTDPRTGSQITVADTQVHTLAYVADGTRTRGILDGRIVTDVAATTTFPGGGGEPSTHLMAVNGTGHCAIEIYALGLWAGSVPTPGQVQSATRNPWGMFSREKRPAFYTLSGGAPLSGPIRSFLMRRSGLSRIWR